MIETNPDHLVESPMFRFECCEHCRAFQCPRHDGHPDPCDRGKLSGEKPCAAGRTMLGEPGGTP